MTRNPSGKTRTRLVAVILHSRNTEETTVHSDAMTKEGLWPGIAFPRVPGHEVVGVIDAVGKDVPERWQPGQRVRVGWHAWHCLSGDNCRGSDYFACQTGAQLTGISFDGGYADYMVAPATTSPASTV